MKLNYAYVQFFFTVMGKVHSLLTKLWQELPQSIKLMNCYGTNITFFIRKQAGKIDNVNTAAIP